VIQVKLPTVIEVEEKGASSTVITTTTVTSQDKQQQQQTVLMGLADSKDMSLTDPLDTIFALAYKNLEEPGAT
jgi:hypothetical protein